MEKFLTIVFAIVITVVLVTNDVLPLWGDILLVLACIGFIYATLRG